jgi:hypothetical protein
MDPSISRKRIDAQASLLAQRSHGAAQRDPVGRSLDVPRYGVSLSDRAANSEIFTSSARHTRPMLRHVGFRRPRSIPEM